MTPSTNSQTRDSHESRTNSPSAAVNFFGGLSKDLWLGALLGLSVLINVVLAFMYSRHTTETRMLEYYLLELDAKFINAGLKDPAEAISKRLQQQKEK